MDRRAPKVGSIIACVGQNLAHDPGKSERDPILSTNSTIDRERQTRTDPGSGRQRGSPVPKVGNAMKNLFGAAVLALMFMPSLAYTLRTLTRMTMKTMKK